MSLIEKSINNLNDKVGYFTAFLALPLIIVVVYEVAMRYLFNAPTVWAFEATTLIYGCHFALGFAYTHKNNGHVSIDIFESRLASKPRTMLRIIVNLLLFVPTIGLLSIGSIRYAADSWGNWELASTSWAPPLYPFKTILCIGFILLFLQGIAKLIGDIRSLKD
jgi:TRAP-type mannitol/chloroaromatic compound transport system permease small subunit